MSEMLEEMKGATVTIAITVTLNGAEKFTEYGGFTAYTFAVGDDPGLFTMEIPDGLAAVQVHHPATHCEACGHRSSCATHNNPALPPGPCTCNDKENP